jgi:hypothetical protein
MRVIGLDARKRPTALAALLAVAGSLHDELDERWRRRTIEKILKRSDAAEIVAELSRKLDERDQKGQTPA